MTNAILFPASVVLGLLIAAIVISALANRDTILTRLGLKHRADKLENFESPHVNDIKTRAESEQAFQDPGPTVILLYAHWCHHCKVMMKAYNDAAANGGAKWLRIEASAAGENVVKRPEVRGFPTIFGVKRDGTIITHEGARDQASLQRFAETLN